MPEVYMKAFLREYSTAIDLDPDEVLSKFERAKIGENFEIEEKVVNINDEEKISPKEKVVSEEVTAQPPNVNQKVTENANKTLYYVLLAVALLLIIFVVYTTFLKEPENIVIAEKPFEETLPKQESVTAQQEFSESKQNENIQQQKPINQTNVNTNLQTDNKIQAENNSNKLELRIVADDNSWIRVIVDEKDNNEFILTKDMTRTLTADKQFFLHIGNSGAIKLYLNNSELEFNKAPNKVRKIIVNKNGVEYIKRTNTTTNEG
jgi:cytoskeletal protein RodZ